jgi:hypothetical protein
MRARPRAIDRDYPRRDARRPGALWGRMDMCTVNAPQATSRLDSLRLVGPIDRQWFALHTRKSFALVVHDCASCRIPSQWLNDYTP